MAAKEDLILIGIVSKPHGIRGLVKVWPLTDFPSRFFDLERVFLVPKNRPHFAARIEDVKTMGKFILIKFEGVDSISDAEKLVGLELAIPREECVELPPDFYYAFDLIGLNVVLCHGEPVGSVVDVQSFPAQDMLIVETPGGKQIMIPMVKEIVREVSLERKEIVVEDWPGLIEEEGA